MPETTANGMRYAGLTGNVQVSALFINKQGTRRTAAECESALAGSPQQPLLTAPDRNPKGWLCCLLPLSSASMGSGTVLPAGIEGSIGLTLAASESRAFLSIVSGWPCADPTGFGVMDDRCTLPIASERQPFNCPHAPPNKTPGHGAHFRLG